VHSVATECNDLVWRTLTAPYRDVRATAALFAKIDVPQTSRVTLLRGDPEELLRSSFASPIAPEDVRGQMDVFSVLEKENTRRRVIGWPRRWNKVERRIYDDIAARHGRVLFASATTVRDRVVFPFARSLEIKKYFQCFFMPRAVAAFFAFPVADAFLVPAVPTGAVSPRSHGPDWRRRPSTVLPSARRLRCSRCRPSLRFFSECGLRRNDRQHSSLRL
jgi:hypothetical protein